MVITSKEIYQKCMYVRYNPFHKHECNSRKCLLDIKKVNYSMLGRVREE
jgi:hypothetical protein